MELIISHNNTDFDGLACMVAASKLYPEAVMVFEGKPTRQVREFLALHKDALPISDIKVIDLDTVSKVVLVDTRSAARIGSLAKLIGKEQVEIHIYDHHPASPTDISGSRQRVEYVGAATTIMVEELLQLGVELTAFEATLLALGIYEDTGNLLFESTTARDAAALSRLLELGANLTVVGQFIERPLSREQKALLNTLLASAKHYIIKGVRVVICSTGVEEFVAGLALLTHKISEIENLDIIFCVVRMDDRVHVVARGKGCFVAVNDIVREFGGAGHAKAASASVKHGEVEGIVKRILELLEEQIVPEIRARQIMSSAVKTVASRSTIKEVGELLLRYGHTGLPVVDDGKLVGIISRRDVDKALNHSLGHAPVSGYMARQVIDIGLDTTLSAIEDLMIDNDIGRLPVVTDGVLVGIVSRSDVLRSLHGQAVPVSQQILRQRSRVQGQEILRLLEELPLEVRDLFRLVKALSEAEGLNVFVVGGFVRDLLLGVPSLDIDLVVEGDGLQFAATLAQALQVTAQFHHQFGTANLHTQSGLDLDVVTARTEHYMRPASLPQVEDSTLKQDLYRRDFTINAMAIALNGDDYASLHDFYGGYRDLQQGEIRILHNFSFVDDPKRILRAIRFEQRLRFRLEAQTHQMLLMAVEDRLLDYLSRDRLRDELVLTLQEHHAGRALQKVVNLGLWQQIFPGVNCPNPLVLSERAKAAQTLLQELNLWGKAKLWQVLLVLLLSNVDASKAEGSLKNLHFDRRSIQLTTEFHACQSALKGFLAQQGELNTINIHTVLAKAPTEILAAVLAIPALQPGVAEYLRIRSQTRVEVAGKDLLALGIPAGPLYSRLLAALWEARLEGRVTSRAEELALVQTLLEEEKNGS